MHESNYLELVNRHLTAENEHDLPGTLATLHPDCVFEDFGLGWIYSGHAGAARYYSLWWAAFDLTVRGERRHWCDGKTLVAETRFTGPHIGTFCGVPATGRTLDLRLAVIVNFHDGLMSGERFYYDSRDLFTQLGVVDASTTAEETPCVWPSLVQPA